MRISCSSRAKERSEEVPVQVLVSGFEQATSVGEWSRPGAASRGHPLAGCSHPRRAETKRSTTRPRRGRYDRRNPLARRLGCRGALHAGSVQLLRRARIFTASHRSEPQQRSHDVFAESVAVVLDGGRCSGLASTVVDLTRDVPVVLREGAISAIEVEKALQL